MWGRWYKYHIVSTTSLPYSQISIYSAITGNTLPETERQNMVSDQEAYNTVSKVIFLCPNGHI